VSSNQWKEAERRVAAFFAANRRPLSGSNSGEGEGDDARHEELYLESKYSKYIPIMRLYRECREKCSKESKVRAAKGKSPRIPVIALQEKNLPGILLCLHSNDLPEFLRIYANLHGFEVIERPENRKAWKRVKSDKKMDPNYRPRKKPPQPRKR